MFRYTKLILALFLTGCATKAGEKVNLHIGIVPTLPPVSSNTALLEEINSTLETADDALYKITEEKHQTQDKILSLKNLVSEEEKLISNLETNLEVKDSLLENYKEKSEILNQRITETETHLNSAIHKCTNQCFPKIEELTQENGKLLNHVDSLQAWAFYLDSLISTNKKLNKKINI